MSRTWCGVLLLLLGAASARAGDEQPAPSVTVLDTAGKPVVGARVYVEGHPFGEIPVPVKVTGSDGTARLDGGSLSATVKLDVHPPASRPDLAATTVEGWDPRAGGPVTLPPGRAIDCSVIDGRGVARFALVLWTTVDGRRSGCAPLYAREMLRGLPRAPVRVLAIPLHAASVWEQVLGETAAPFVDVAVGTEALTLSVWTPTTQPEYPQTAIHVRGPDGSAPARAYVVASRADHVTAARAIRGEAAVGFLPWIKGPVRVLAYGARDALGQPLPWAAVQREIGVQDRDVTLDMPVAVEVRGQVVDEGQRPVAGARVVAHAVLPGVDEPLGFLAEATTDATGSFSLIGLAEGSAELQVQAGPRWLEGERVRFEVPSASIVLEAPLALPARILVVDSEARPVAGVPWTVMEVDEWAGGWQSSLLASGRSDSKGRIDVPALDPRRSMSLEIECGDERPDLGSLTIKPWRPGTKTVVLPKAYTVDIRVTDAEGRPVRAMIACFYEQDRATVNQQTDALGRATLRGLDPDAPLELQARRVEGGETVRSDRVRVTATSSRVTVTLELAAPDGP
ncbi:MAG: carboxypeptidase regulatory-like domain-containing protein [Planctomycetota bacterium]